jgi:pyruvate formate lyase activating enzyme
VVSRRALLTAAARCVPAAGLCLAGGETVVCALAAGGRGARASPLGSAPRPGVKARYWVTFTSPGVTCSACHLPDEELQGKTHAHDPKKVRCLLCAQECVIVPGARGRCRARVNLDGELRSLVYGRPVAVHVDPIEKKPFYHFLPGASAYSLATTGCPLRCRFCQNWELSQASPEDYDVPFFAPTDIVREAVRHRARVIAFTYNEPTVFAEYLLDIAAAARGRGLRSVLVSCGFMREAPLADMCRALDAIKIDLKGFSEEFYREVSGAALRPVLRSIGQVARSGVHLEIVNLVVPTLNDSERSLRELARWVAGEVGPDVPLHFTRFHPDYQLRNLPPTPVATLERARAIAREAGLRYAYVGNVPGHPGNDTYCPRCNKAVVRRQSFFVSEMHVSNGRCSYCGERIAGVW